MMVVIKWVGWISNARLDSVINYGLISLRDYAIVSTCKIF